MLIDSHCHLTFSGFGDFLKPRLAGKTLGYYSVDLLVDRASQTGVKCLLNIGTHLSDVEDHTAISEKFSNVFRSIGIHPEYAREHYEKFSFDEMREIFRKYCDLNKTVAIGEIGLDYYVNRDKISDTKEQKKIFSFQLELAEEFCLPVVIHTREAWRDTMEILEAHPKVKGVIHCFSGEKKFAERVLKTSFYFGIGGTLTFKKNTILQEAVRDILPLDKILLETDSPFLAPVPFRGKVNEPAFVAYVAEKVSELKGISVAQVSDSTGRNFFNLFKKANFSEFF